MSHAINNREYRKKVIKDLLRKLHAGATVDDVKQEFDAVFSGVSAAEISEAEQALIAEGVPVQVPEVADVERKGTPLMSPTARPLLVPKSMACV